MAYYSRRRLQKIMSVQKVWSDYRQKGVTSEWIFRNLIEPNYYISRSTFYNYLTVPVRKYIRELEASEAENGSNQMKLF